MILAKPKYGWSALTLMDVNGVECAFRLSYLDDVPSMLLDQLILGLTRQMDVALSFEAEGWDHRWIITDYLIYVIEEKDEALLYEFEIKKEDFARQILTDLKANFKDWADWDALADYRKPEEVEADERRLREKIEVDPRNAEIIKTVWGVGYKIER